MMRTPALRMTVSSAIVGFVLCGGAWHVAGARAPAQDGAKARTVWDGVYAEAQAARGKDQYLKECSSCHLADLTGSEQAVPLNGEAFILQWENKSVNDLFTSIRTTMPQGTPGQLGTQAYVDIVAFLLQANGFPAGAGELTRDADLQKAVQIVRKKEGASGQPGQAAFARACSSCHGVDAKGQNGPALLPFEKEYPEVRGIVRDGRGEMPSIPPADLSDEELTQIVAYLKKASSPKH
jgi:mono/diheme cytochrome c family protein